MLVSWNWLKEYVDLDMDVAELEQRLSMSGLNHESTRRLEDDLVIDLEVTSNRPDCLGHVGVAREIAVLYERPLRVPDPRPATSPPRVNEVSRVTIECPDLCPRYTARVIRGVRVKPSPAWLANRLRNVGIGVVNNVVDITNYVMLERGQPLHAFDLRRLDGPEIIVREARQGESFEAIDHRTYELSAGMCVIADARRAVALGGVMGGADSEVDDDTVDLLIEAARFAPLSIRNTARQLNLHSPSSYRFERALDPAGVDWASRRCCELILDLAGGELLEGVLDEGDRSEAMPEVTLRLSQLKRILGIEIDRDQVERILTALGGRLRAAGASTSQPAVTIEVPSWRGDLAREVDLVEEVARIHGYDEIPEDVGVPMCPSHRRDEDRVLGKARHVLTAAGFDEAMTASMVPEEWSEAFSPWTDAPPLRCSAAMLKGADRLRRSLVPSLLESRRINESLSNDWIELFETAHIYLPQTTGLTERRDLAHAPALPHEQWTLGLTSGRGFFAVKGVLECLTRSLAPQRRLETRDAQVPMLDGARSCRLYFDDRLLGFLGEVSRDGLRRFGLRQPATVAELNLGVLAEGAELVPQHADQSPYPAIARDLNLIVDEGLTWAELSRTIRESAGENLESLDYRETYRDPQRDGAGRKRLLFSITLRSGERTLTSEEADEIRQLVEKACEKAHAAVLVK